MAGPMLRTPHTRLAALVLVFLAGAGATAENPAAADGPRLGFLLDAARVLDLPRVSAEPDAAPIVRLEARWDQVERVPGAYDWTAIAPAVDTLDRAGYRVVLALTSTHPHYLPDGATVSPLVGDSMQAWLEFLRSAARTLAGRVELFELGKTVAGRSDEAADIQALVLKHVRPGLKDAVVAPVLEPCPADLDAALLEVPVVDGCPNDAASKVFAGCPAEDLEHGGLGPAGV